MKKILLIILSLLLLFGCSSTAQPESSEKDASLSDEIFSSEHNSSEDSSEGDKIQQTEEINPPHMDFGTLDESSFL